MTEDTEFQDSSTPEEEVEETSTADDDNTPTLEDFNRLSETKKQISARLAKAEAELKKYKTQTKGETLTTNTSGDLLEMQKEILINKGFGEATLEQAQRLSNKLGISIFEAVKDPLIAKFAEAEAQENKSKKAQLGASNGSSSSSPATFRQGMSEEEHRAAWAKYQNR